ncbi:MAG: hypothetical protein Q8M94_19450 [Ignavibacteria bacterium]|nr:hypothetical protein [Ignavibacteria bacterium]
MEVMSAIGTEKQNTKKEDFRSDRPGFFVPMSMRDYKHRYKMKNTATNELKRIIHSAAELRNLSSMYEMEDSSTIRIPLSEAVLCVNCENIHRADRCPVCMSVHYLSLKKILS